jgi:hypothetical protein
MGAKLVRVVGFEPTASCIRGRHSRRAELHPADKQLQILVAEHQYCRNAGHSVEFKGRSQSRLHKGQVMAKRTTHRSSKGTKLYAVRDKSGKFKDIQTYKRAHGADLKRRSKKEK